MRALAVLCLLVSAGCRTAPAPVPDGPPTHLAEAPAPLSGETNAPSATATAGRAPGSPGPGATGTQRAPTESAAPTPGAPSRYRTIARALDDAGDAGLRAPAYADLRAVTLRDDGTRARVVVEVAATIPNPMPEDEQLAIGVDLFRRASQQESDYQLYALGTSDGWLAYLQGPDGFVRYPGRFELGRAQLVFEVPWSSLGNLRGRAFSTFLDWDRRGTVIAEAAADRAPDRGRTSFSR